MAQVEELELEYNEGVMLLPIMAQHTIDERSPLWGHSHDSLQVCNTVFRHNRALIHKGVGTVKRG